VFWIGTDSDGSPISGSHSAYSSSSSALVLALGRKPDTPLIWLETLVRG
jgi:hypothetical protein